MPQVLTDKQLKDYKSEGFILVENVLSPEEIQHLRAVTDEFVERSRTLTQHDDVYDFEDGHSAAEPRIRRIKYPHCHHKAYADLARHPIVVKVLQDLWGPNIRFQSSKLNMKSAGFGSPVEWHQDWAFYPHTNDDMAAEGLMFDDCMMENGPLMVIPGSHRGPIYDHHANGRFCGAINPVTSGIDFSKAAALTGKAGSMTVHHVRAIHGSAPNVSKVDRRLFLLMHRAADAWPIFREVKSIEAFDSLLVSGTANNQPRMEALPVRIPLPTSTGEGSIYVRQNDMTARYFEVPKAPPAGARQVEPAK
jgi:ectoine hydroxylase-related dioxygenase (phytanoyl-CoA dioxygenase family)